MKRKVFVIDGFCGAGGLSTGVHLAGENVSVVVCVNHDKTALDSHKANHPHCLHLEEDIRDMNVVYKIARVVGNLKKRHPDCIIVGWFSLECTNYSKAKGGLPRDADSRTLANCVPDYLENIPMDILWIENVVEFMAWGPLDQNGKPKKRKNGRDYLRWIKTIKSLGYKYDHRILNSADFGAYTSRKRLFIQFNKGTVPFAWPEATHAKNPSKTGMFGCLKQWKAVKDVLDLEDQGKSIFIRKKPLSEKTLERIFAGLNKFVAKGDTVFIKKYYSGDPYGKVLSINVPASTVTTIDHHAIVNTVQFTKVYNSGEPRHRCKSMNEPVGSLTTQNSHAVVSANFMIAYNGKANENNHHVCKPCPTITTKDRLAFICVQYGKPYNTPLEAPCNTITTTPKQCLVYPILINGNTSTLNSNSEVSQPAPTICASNRNHYLLNPQWNSKGSSINKPCFTLIARMDKTPPYLITTENGQLGISLFLVETPMMVAIKYFMAAYGIIDIKMRMLKVIELKKIMGFPENYILLGTKTQQKKFIGNAVEVNQARILIQTMTKAIAS